MENSAERAAVWVKRIDAIVEMESLFYDEALEPIQGYDAEMEALHTLKVFVMNEVGRKETPAEDRLRGVARWLGAREHPPRPHRPSGRRRGYRPIILVGA